MFRMQFVWLMKNDKWHRGGKKRDPCYVPTDDVMQKL